MWLSKWRCLDGLVFRGGRQLLLMYPLHLVYVAVDFWCCCPQLTSVNPCEVSKIGAGDAVLGSGARGRHQAATAPLQPFVADACRL